MTARRHDQHSRSGVSLHIRTTTRWPRPGHGLPSMALIWLLVALAACGQPTSGSVESTGQPTALPTTPAASGGTSTAFSCPDASGPIAEPIVFAANNTLYAIGEQGGNATTLMTLPDTIWAQYPIWSPDGATLAFTLKGTNTDPDLSWLPLSMICGLDRTTGKGKVLARGDALSALSETAWTSDGKALLVTLSRYEVDATKQYVGTTTAIASHDLTSGKLQVLVAGGSSPALSPDGARLSYLQTDPASGTMQLMVSQATGDGAQAVNTADAKFSSVSAPNWSPDGQILVFTASGQATSSESGMSPARALFDRLLGVSMAEAHGLPADLWVLGIENSSLHQVTKKGLDDPRASWSPDGRQLVYTSAGGGVIVVEIASGQEHILSSLSTYGGITWARR